MFLWQVIMDCLLNTIIVLPSKTLEPFNYRVNINEASQKFFFQCYFSCSLSVGEFRAETTSAQMQFNSLMGAECIQDFKRSLLHPV